MKVIEIIDSKKYRYHRTVLNDWTCAMKKHYGIGEVFIVDIADNIASHERYSMIEDYKADLIITMDFSGFDMLTGSNNLSLNCIPAKVAHILFHNKDKYRLEVSYRQNFSMFTCINQFDDVTNWENTEDNISNIVSAPDIEYIEDNEEVHDSNQKKICEWLAMFDEIAMIRR